MASNADRPHGAAPRGMGARADRPAIARCAKNVSVVTLGGRRPGVRRSLVLVQAIAPICASRRSSTKAASQAMPRSRWKTKRWPSSLGCSTLEVRGWSARWLVAPRSRALRRRPSPSDDHRSAPGASTTAGLSARKSALRSRSNSGDDRHRGRLVFAARPDDHERAAFATPWPSDAPRSYYGQVMRGSTNRRRRRRDAGPTKAGGNPHADAVSIPTRTLTEEGR